MKNPFLGLFRTRDKPRDEISAAPTFHFGSSSSGKAVNPGRWIVEKASWQPFCKNCYDHKTGRGM